MTGFFDRMLGRSKGSSSTAKERLRFVLVHDRINLPPDQLEAMKQEILQVISKYVSVDDRNVDIAMQQRDQDNLLVAEIPFSKRANANHTRHRDEDADLDTDTDRPATVSADTSNKPTETAASDDQDDDSDDD